MTFGQYRGQPLDGIASGYLRWVLTPQDNGETPCKSEWLADEIEAELARRKAQGDADDATPVPARPAAAPPAPA